MTCKSCSKELTPFEAKPLVLDGNVQEGEFCESCKTDLQLEFYREGFESLKKLDDISVKESNLFRILMLNVAEMDKFSEDSKGKVKIFISERKEGWEKLSIDKVIFFLDAFEAHARCFAEILHKKASLDELKTLNKKEETKEKVKKEPKTQVSDGLTGTYEPDFKKALLGVMKNLKLPEAAAVVMVKNMMGVQT